MKLNAQNASIRFPASRRASRSAEQLMQCMTLVEMAAQPARNLADIPGDFELGAL